MRGHKAWMLAETEDGIAPIAKVCNCRIGADHNADGSLRDR